MKYAQIVLANKSNATDVCYTYGVKDNESEIDKSRYYREDIQIGSKVRVPFGKGNKLKEGYVMDVTDNLPEDSDFAVLKYIEDVDFEISLNDEMVETSKWMKHYYMTRYMECLNLFLPVGKKAKRRVKREVVDDYEGEEQNIEQLTDEQKSACHEIEEAMNSDSHELFLLQGVTGSGKTEVYMQAVEMSIKNGKSSIVIVPEVALTKQIIDRFISRFGREKVAVMHSKMTAGERYDQWQKIRSGKVPIVIGARSAVFAPVENIGVIIIDEEHESSYKSDMSPKYETWRVADKRTEFYQGVVILGSGTPSVESLYRAESGQFKKLMLTERYNKVPLPEAIVVDMRDEMKAGNKTVFSRALYDQIKEALACKKQIILFINRRGYSPYVFCRECGYVVECETCNQPMNYHKKIGKMVCHYCSRKEAQPEICPKCGSKYIRYFGAGTEQIEDAAKKMFKDASLERLDSDTGKTVKDINKILNNFSKGKIDILVGTQLVGKGMDNPNVKVVGIMAVDTMINYPDYRAQERAFQLITQAGGRAGRGDEVGKVVIQTYNPEAYPIVYGSTHNVAKFYQNEIRKRMILENPPFSNLVQVIITSNDLTGNKVNKIAERWMNKIKDFLGKDKILSVKNRKRESDFQRCIIYKFEKEKAEEFRKSVNEFKEELRNEKISVSFIVEFEPNSLWR